MRQTAFTCAAIFAIAIMAAPAPPIVTVRDRFNNNHINMNLWEVRGDGGLFLSETNQRLQLNANGSTGARSYAALDTRSWGIDWRYSATITFDYRLNLPSPPGDRLAAIGVGLSVTGAYLDSLTGVTAGIQREHGALYLVIGQYDDGELVGLQGTPISQTTGTVTVSWNKPQDRLTVTGGGGSLSLNGLFAEYGPQYKHDPIIISFGGLTANGNLELLRQQGLAR